jgi:hypothetical protein
VFARSRGGQAARDGAGSGYSKMFLHGILLISCKS